MKTLKFKEAIYELSHEGFIKEPSNHFSKHTCIYNKYGICVGWITYNCYFEIVDALGYAHNIGILKSGKYEEYAGVSSVWHFSTINGDFKYVDEDYQRKVA
jgi:hypothetical protein